MRRLRGTFSTPSRSLGCKLYMKGGIESTNILGMLNLPWYRYEKDVHKNWSTCRHGWTAGERLINYRVSSNRNKRCTNTFICGIVCYIRQGEKKIKLTVTYDMGWQNRSSRRIYDSSSRYVFIIGGTSKGHIGMFLFSKFWRKCDAVDKKEK